MPRRLAGPRLVQIAIFVVLVFGLLYGLYALISSRSYQLFGEIVPRVETAEPVVALTFDDGPSASRSAEVLEILQAQDVRGTFFLVGRDVEAHPEEAVAIAAAGHEIGNHSFSHPRMVFRLPSTIRDEVERADAAIRATGYRGVLHFRPPYGKKLVGLPWYLAQNDRKTIMWDVEPDSFPEVASNVDAYVDHVVTNAKNGSIVLMHVMYGGGDVARRALPRVIEGLRARGFGFVTVSELLGKAGATAS